MILLFLQVSEHLYVINPLVDIGHQGYLTDLAHDIQQHKIKPPKVQATTAIYPVYLSTIDSQSLQETEKSFVDVVFVTIHLDTRGMQSILICSNK